MFGGIRIGTIRGIPLFISQSWLIVFFLFLWSFASSYYPDRYHNWTSQAYFAAALITVVLFFASIVLHELGHAAIAARTGIRTRRITLLPIGGVAEIEKEAQRPRDEFAIAIAGPITSLLLGGAFFGLAAVTRGLNQPLHAITAYLGLANLFLGIFNLLPGYPMDGGRVLRAIVWGATKSYGRGTRVAASVGSLVAYGFIFLGVTVAFRGQIASGVILAFTGWFILSSAQASVQQLAAQRGQGELRDTTVGQVMSDAFHTVEANATLAAVVADVFLAHNTRYAAVTRGGVFVGLLTLGDVMRVPQERWPATFAYDVMVPRQQLLTVQPAEPIIGVLPHLQMDGVNQLPVVAGDTLVGLLSRGDLVRYLQLRQSLHLAPAADDRVPPPDTDTPEEVPQ